MKSSRKLQHYKFTDSQRLIYSTIVGNVVLGVLLMFPDFSNVLRSPHVRWCLISGLVLLVLKFIYDWKSFTINIGILVVYLLAVLLEYLQEGLPGQSIQNVEQHKVSKGIMMEMLIAMLPMLYLALRAFLGLGLVGVIKASRSRN